MTLSTDLSSEAEAPEASSALFRQRRSSTRWLQHFIALVCLAIVGLEGWRDWTEYEAALEDIETNTANLAHSLKQHAEDTFEMTDYALSAVVEMVQAYGTSPEAMAHLHSILVNRVSLLPRLKEITVYDAQGKWLASSSQALFPDKTSQTDSPYFAYHQNSLSRRPYFAPPDRNLPLGERTTAISRRFTNPDGSFGGVVVASIDPNYFARFYSRFVIGSKGAIVLSSKDGTVLSRYPFLADFAGADPTKANPIIERLNRAPSGTYRFVSPLDGLDRIGGFDSGTNFPFVIVASAGRDDALAAWWREVFLRGSAIGILVAVIGLLGWSLVTQLRRRERAEAKLAVLARIDGLTGLANRRSFDERLAQEWRRSIRDGTPLSLILIDVDQFKQFNDLHGHQAGDDCLRAVAHVVDQIARRPADLAARYGGEELVLLLPATGEEGSVQIAERLRSNVEALALPHPRNEPKCVVTVSLGIATLNPQPGSSGDRCEALITLADNALYDAKRQGRNKVVMAHRELAV